MEKRVLPNDVLLGEVGEFLSEGREVVIMTKGQSMLPFIRGSRDSVSLRLHVTVQVGDIVLARIAPGRYVLHRVFAIDADAVTLKGDGNLVGTEHCLKSDILGTVEKIIPPKGRDRTPGKAKLWKHLPVIVRRVLLGLYRRLIYNENK